MLKACLVGAAVTLALIAIPVVHFITGLPPGTALLIGLFMAALLVAPVAGVLFLMSLFWGGGAILVLVGTGAFAVWIVLLGTLGALIGGNSVRKQSAAE
jgi:hypothetical protein